MARAMLNILEVTDEKLIISSIIRINERDSNVQTHMDSTI